MRCGGLDLPEARFPIACREREFGDTTRRCWKALWRRWRESPAKPLHIVGRLASGYVAGIDGALHLDSILSAACFDLYASVIDCRPDDEPYVLPLPLALAWVSPSDRPLWLATDLRPVGEAVSGPVYLHSHYPTDRADLASRQAVLTSAGRYKDSRLPLSLTMTEAVEGWCLGDHDAIRMLLDRVTHVGRKAARGHGRVLSWQAEAADFDAAAIMERRPAPIDYLIDQAIPAARISPRQGWTPPYWHPGCQGPTRIATWTR